MVAKLKPSLFVGCHCEAISSFQRVENGPAFAFARFFLPVSLLLHTGH